MARIWGRPSVVTRHYCSLLDVAHVALHVLAFEDSRPQVALEPPNFDSIQWCVLAVHLRVLDLGQAEQFSVKGALFAPLDLPRVAIALTRMHSTHVTTKGLAC